MQKFIQAGEIAFKENTTQTLELEVGSVNTALYLIIDYLINIGPNGAPTGFMPFAGIFKMIRELKITINGTDDILRMSGPELMAVYLADNYQLPPSAGLVSRGEEMRSVFPINHWATNTEVVGLTAHDYRRANKVVLSITWGDLGDIYRGVNEATIDAFKCTVEQQAVHRYVSPLDGRVRKNGRPSRYNPAVRYFFKTEETFTADATAVEIGRVETQDLKVCSKGFLIFAEQLGNITGGIINGNLQVTQGDTTLLTVSTEVLRASMETVKGFETPEEIIYVPFSGLLRGNEIEKPNQWKDDLIIRGNVYTNAKETKVTVLSDAYRQERLK